MSVEYTPSQVLNPATPLLQRSSPIRLIKHDVELVWARRRYLPAILLPRNLTAPGREVNGVVQVGAHVVWAILSVVAIIFGIFVTLTTPGVAAALYWVAFAALLTFLPGWLMGWGVNDDGTVQSDYPDVEDKDGEKWIFVNGYVAFPPFDLFIAFFILTNPHQDFDGHLMEPWPENVNVLAHTFGRPVTGIHNRTFGLILDLIECLIQRNLFYATEDTRTTYNCLKRTLCDPSINKVVLIAHSQGTIIISNVLDILFAELAPDVFDKLEVYTFGSAANHFHNALRSVVAPGIEEDRQIKVIEHYVNENDFVAQIGIQHFATGVPGAQYLGKIFTRKAEGGHMFNEHYMFSMFGQGTATPFLNTHVVSNGVNMGLTVRELSRLWRYLGGNSP
ncbi:hypothetical protein CC1G_13022 [Coprinopsis cinerea okayama7|uniref:DUF676 domain-containing protein n=1 Tax=Coprinopsis cinerea (strain Okayama-7 / 130 / ATCC MYA-4618 / FGSC 9003) TaxID=240176 RepID=A8N420_COPC7|nr:hypothetical protein CC1G_13022 [Coprinopsis cinerea okayama7\|eukprot:XP_001829615.2 hypothetical protein CC1G_13022 [Coprinopsis cinerea okayama7\